MTVDELRKALADLPGVARVVLQKDPEGNGFFFANGADDDAYVPHGFDRDRIDEVKAGFEIEEDENDPGDYEQVVVIYP